MTTGLAIRTRAIDAAGRVLGRNGKTTALASGTDHVTDTLRWKMAGLSVEDPSGAFIRITGVSNSDQGYVGKVQRLEPSTGKLYIDPAVGAAIVSGCTYELWYHGIWPDDVDRARDQIVLPHRTPIMRSKPLSVLAQVEEWSTGAYSATAGGVTNATALAAALSFPDELFTQGMTVTNSGVNGILSSEVLKVQPQQSFRLWGRVSVAGQTASVRVRDLSNTADISLTGATSTFTLNGWQWFEIEFVIPANCGRIQIWLGGASASCVATWAGVGLLPQSDTWLSMASRVLSKHDVGRVYQYMLPTTVNGNLFREEIRALRDPAGDGVTLLISDGGAGQLPVYYQERHRYAALQSDWMAVSDRTTGDAASSDVNVDYAAWALIVAILEPLERTGQLNRLYLDAAKNLREMQREFGMDPMVAPEFPSSNQTGIPVFTL